MTNHMINWKWFLQIAHSVDIEQKQQILTMEKV